MFIFEHQAKELMRESGIPVPRGLVATTESRAVEAAGELGEGPWVVKAQVHAGGRAQGYFLNDRHLSGVEFASTALEVGKAARSMLGSILVTPQTTGQGEKVHSVYIESVVKTPLQLFLAMLVDGDSGQIACLATTKGGEEVETAVQVDPEILIKTLLGSTDAVPEGVTSAMGSQLGLTPSAQESLSRLIVQLHAMFVEKDLSLIEINPLGVKDSGSVIALDARITVDDNALYRQSKLAALGVRTESGSTERIASQNGFNFVRLDGDVGTFSSGAGLAMATVDALTHLGARPANFLDIPPVLEVSRVKQAFLLLLADDRIQSLFVNVFGAGIMRCDTIADGLLLAHLEKPISVPVIMRLAGTNAELAISRLERSGLPIQFVNDLASGAEKIASLQKEPPVSRPRTGWFGRLLGFRTRRHASGKS